MARVAETQIVDGTLRVEPNRITSMVGDENWVEEASTLGLPIGWWPEKLVAGNYLFHRKTADMQGGEIMGVRYEAECGKKLLVIND